MLNNLVMSSQARPPSLGDTMGDLGVGSLGGVEGMGSNVVGVTMGGVESVGMDSLKRKAMEHSSVGALLENNPKMGRSDKVLQESAVGDLLPRPELLSSPGDLDAEHPSGLTGLSHQSIMTTVGMGMPDSLGGVLTPSVPSILAGGHGSLAGGRGSPTTMLLGGSAGPSPTSMLGISITAQTAAAGQQILGLASADLDAAAEEAAAAVAAANAPPCPLSVARRPSPIPLPLESPPLNSIGMENRIGMGRLDSAGSAPVGADESLPFMAPMDDGSPGATDSTLEEQVHIGNGMGGSISDNTPNSDPQVHPALGLPMDSKNIHVIIDDRMDDSSASVIGNVIQTNSESEAA